MRVKLASSVVQLCLMAQLWQALVQYRRSVKPFSSFHGGRPSECNFVLTRRL